MPRERKGVSKPKSKIRDTRRYFVIASEGAATERIYFEGLQEKISNDGILDRLIKIEFLARHGHDRSKSAHTDVIKQLDGYRKSYRLDDRDEMWLVIDRDRKNNPEENISLIAQRCFQKGYFLGLSNPNFELWLLLHLKDLSGYSIEQLEDFLDSKKVSASRNILEKELADLLGGYNKSKYSAEKFLPHISTAIERAKILDDSAEERWIEGRLGTRVYLLVEKVLGDGI